jgi:hypothetical protein
MKGRRNNRLVGGFVQIADISNGDTLWLGYGHNYWEAHVKNMLGKNNVAQCLERCA